MTLVSDLRPGVRLTADGADFTLSSSGATAVELLLFESAQAASASVIPLQKLTGSLWHARVRGVTEGQLYGYRVHGPDDPAHGQRFNPAKLLLDPYARALGRQLRWDASLHSTRPGPGGRKQECRNNADSTPFAPLGMVVSDAFDWQGVEAPAVPASETVLYETHVRGFTKLHPDVPAELRGTYAGVASAAAIGHLQELGVTSVQLLPVHAFVNDERLLDQGLSQYWGYNSLAFFAPEPSYATEGRPERAVHEFKAMVRELHRAGLEVILDVVYNHTGEGNQEGPTLSFRGIDNSVYYRLNKSHPANYEDWTGTGNTLDVSEPVVMQLLLDSLRYWVEHMRVDGFRFDLAVSLGRENPGFNPAAAFFQAVQQDPVLARTKLYAEPWDLGVQGYQAGNFSWRWAEWNGKYRDCVRSFWRGERGLRAELATRLSGSSDLFAHNGRQPAASVNFVTAHDGFTLLDLVSYRRKHNEANGEGNRDGSDDNLSQNCGVEGPSSDPEVTGKRERLRRALLATLLVSQGTPLLLGGDELGRTQQGNNNAYCQDNEVSWFNWQLDAADREFLEFTRKLLRFRKEHAALRQRTWLTGEHDPQGVQDVTWWHAAGREMNNGDWNGSETAFGMLLDGVPEAGRAAVPLLLVLHAFHDQQFTLPDVPGSAGGSWQPCWSSAGAGAVTPARGPFRPGDSITLEGFAISAFSGQPD